MCVATWQHRPEFGNLGVDPVLLDLKAVDGGGDNVVREFVCHVVSVPLSPYIILTQRDGGKFRLESISKNLPDDSVGSLIPAQDTCGSYG